MTAITAETIAAEALLGLTYTTAERAQMVGNLEGQIASAVARRAVPLANAVPMALRFDPRLPGFAMPQGMSALRLSDQHLGPLPTADDDIAFSPSTRMARWIASGEMTSTRLTTIYLDRISTLGSRLECFATVTPDLRWPKRRRRMR